ncbi:hypothetical protein [Dietzia sp. MNB45]|uniref:hypothetical protein n=1 Tax=Dietzia sp. MNB45 TaxID=3238800 RepID=UPI003F7DD61F
MTISKRLAAGTALAAAKAEDDVAGVLEMLEDLIIDWDFTDEDQKKLTIEVDVLKQLSLEDFTQLAQYVTELATDSKDAKLPAEEVKG